jgi:hypothetical protein
VLTHMYWLLIPQRAARWTNTEWSLDVLTIVRTLATFCDIVWTREVTDWHDCGAEDGCMIGALSVQLAPHLHTQQYCTARQWLTAHFVLHCEIAALTALAAKAAVLRNVTPCGMLEVYRRFTWYHASIV